MTGMSEGSAKRIAAITTSPSGGLRVTMRSFLLGFLLTVVACAPKNSAETIEVDPNRGAELYRQQCQSCHGGSTGGRATDFPPQHNAQGHTWHHGDCELIRWTLEGKPSSGATGTTMPAFADRLSEEDVLDILAHIRTWWTEEQREAQARVTEGVCE
jgi:mono/diheme cytochrome c family protein